ncbi:MAG: hypothetical protein AABX70_07180 [Nanoarchaeota archaeon]
MPSKKPPKVTLRYSGVYDHALYLLTEKHSALDHDYFMRRKVEALEGVQRLQREVLPRLKSYLENLQSLLGVSWESREVIGYILPYSHRPGAVESFSDPLTLFLKHWEGERLFSFSAERLLEHLVYEFCRIVQGPLLKTAYYKELALRLRERSPQVISHVLTYAMFRKVANEEEWRREVSLKTQTAHKLALDWVQREGAGKLIEEAKSYLIKKKRSKSL